MPDSIPIARNILSDGDVDGKKKKKKSVCRTTKPGSESRPSVNALQALSSLRHDGSKDHATFEL